MDTRQLIFDVAFDLFIKKGYKKTTLREIAKEANVNLGLIPYYFGSKETLGAEVFTSLVSRIRERIDYSLISLNDSIEKFYYGYIMTQYYLNMNSLVNEFYNEFLITSDINLHLNVATQKELTDIAIEYQLAVTESNMMNYCTVVLGVERALLAKKQKKNIAMSYWEINQTLASIALCLIGIDYQIVKNAINNVNDRLKCLPYDWKTMD